jgi:hypothetical protein
MVNNPAVRDTKQQKQDTSSDENLAHFSLKMLCFAGLAPYEKICKTPRKLKMYRAYQVTLYILYCPALFSQIVKLYGKSEDLQVALEIITHIVMGVGSYIIPFLINWNEASKIICKIHMSMSTESKIQTDRKKMEILRERENKCKFMSLFILILGEVMICCDLFDIFILHFLELIVGAEHKYKRNPNAANMYESLLLEKYPFSCWTPFDEKSSMVHIAIYIYTIIPALAEALKAGAMVFMGTCTLTYLSLQFHFVKESLEDLSNMEDSDSPIEQNIFSTPEEQHMCEGLNYRNVTVPATYGGSFQPPSQAKLLDCWNKHLHRDKTISIADHVNGKDHKEYSDGLHSDNRSFPEDCLLNIIKDHQEAIW